MLAKPLDLLEVQFPPLCEDSGRDSRFAKAHRELEYMNEGIEKIAKRDRNTGRGLPPGRKSFTCSTAQQEY